MLSKIVEVVRVVIVGAHVGNEFELWGYGSIKVVSINMFCLFSSLLLLEYCWISIAELGSLVDWGSGVSVVLLLAILLNNLDL